MKDRQQDGEDCSEESGQQEEAATEHPHAREDDDQGSVNDGRVEQAAFETLLIRLGAPGHFDGGGDGFGSGDGAVDVVGEQDESDQVEGPSDRTEEHQWPDRIQGLEEVGVG
ncbi:MAG: hypothetical protein BWY82_01284 [Verrucomicrobia bacterium ADurb.Bin474]|nr:MAG: hypothetical protein BWY82_01284 [Verrucomicrobia bacterium ADurb.Bin474]